LLGFLRNAHSTNPPKRQSGTTLAQRVTEMATIRRRGNSWHAQIRRQGLPTLTRSFRQRSHAELWARQRETEIDRGELPVNSRMLRSHTLRGLLQRYRDAVTPRKRGAAQERYKLRVLLRHPMVELSLDRLAASDLARYRDDRLKVVSGDTVRRELALVQHCLELANKEWGIPLLVNPVRQIKLPAPGNSRERRTTAAELGQLIAACRNTRSHWLPNMIIMAVETGMRRGRVVVDQVDRCGPEFTDTALGEHQERPSSDHSAFIVRAAGAQSNAPERNHRLRYLSQCFQARLGAIKAQSRCDRPSVP
jgi:hypothetical protein